MALRFIVETLAPRGVVLSIGATVIVRAALLGLGMATTVLVARQLGPTGRGEYAVAIALIGIGIQVANLGVHTSSSWAVARSPALLGPLLANGVAVAALVGTLTAVVGWILLGVLPATPALPTGTLLMAMAAIPIGLAYLIGQNLMLGLHRIRVYNVLEIGNRSLAFLGIAMLALAGTLTSGLAVAATLTALAITLVATIGGLFRGLQSRVWPRLLLIRELSGYGLRAYIVALLTFLVLRLDLLLVERLKGSADAGQYSIAISIAEVVTLPAIVTATILFPRLSGMPDCKQRGRMTSRAGVVAAIVTLAASGVVVLIAQPLVEVVFGPEFLPSVEPALWLLPGSIAFAVYSVVLSYYYSIGTPTVTIYVPAAGLVANIGLNVILIPVYGIVGAALASSLTYCAMLLLTLIDFRRRRA